MSEKVSSVLNKNSIGPVLIDLTKLNFSARSGFYQNSNLWPATMFKYTVKRKLLKMFNYYKFLPNVTMWYYNMLIRFMENCSGKKVYLKFNPFIENSLTFVDIARCRLWSMHTNSFLCIIMMFNVLIDNNCLYSFYLFYCQLNHNVSSC